MIPRVKLDEIGRDPGSAFDAGEAGRPLRMIFDRATLGGADVDLLLELCVDNGVEAYSTSPDDPVETLTIGEPGSDDQAVMSTPTRFGGVGPVSQLRRRAEAAAAETGATVEEIFPSILVTGAGVSWCADAVVTGSPHLLAGPTPRYGNTLDVAEALALLGLWLRMNDNFTVGRIASERDFFGHPVNLGWWISYLVMTREQLPSMWRWFSGCVYADNTNGDMTALGESVFRRVDRALRIRDQLHVQCLRKPTERTNDEALFQFDVLLFTLNGAFDGAARVAHRAYALGDGEYRAGWTSAPWRKRLEGEAPELAGLYEYGSENWRLLRLITLLRNTIHGAPMRSIGTSGSNRRSLVAVPGEERAAISEQLEALGGAASWGARLSGDETWIEPDLFTERLMPAAIALLDETLAQTDVRRLPGIGPDTDLTTEPPEKFPFSAEIRRRLRLMTGITALRG